MSSPTDPADDAQDRDLAGPSPVAARLTLRYPGTCRSCGIAMPARTRAVHEPERRTVLCLPCASEPPFALGPPASRPAPVATATAPPPGPSAGVAGASARREHERRRARDEARLRERWGRLGGLAVAIAGQRQSTRAWAVGAHGEEVLGARLDALVGQGAAVLHDRRVPGSRANIDHLVVTGGGVWVVDAKRYRGRRPELRIDGGLLRPRSERLVVGGRDRDGLVGGMLRQIDLVRQQVGDTPVTGVLCFVEADWPLLGGGFSTRGVRVQSPRTLVKTLARDAGEVDVAATQALLGAGLPPA